MNFRFSSKALLLLLLVIPLTVGLWVRYKPVGFWLEHKETFFVEDRPIFTAYDSYYFARLADDYRMGVFKAGERDPLRFVPDYTEYPEVIPFYSWLFAHLSQIFNKPVENLAFWLTPLLAVLFVIPLTLLLYKLGTPLGALGASLTGVLSFIYLVRSSLNRLDTDSIIYFSIFAIPLGVYLYSTAQSRREKYIALFLLFLFVHLFYWGYLHPELIFAFWLFSVLYLLYPHIRERQRLGDKNLWKEVRLITLVFNPLILTKGVFNLAAKVYVYILHFGKPVEGGFPNVQVSISELRKFDTGTIADITVGNLPLFIVGALGLLLFAYRKPRAFILFLPTLLMGLIALKGASRFAMFLAPLLGLGIGFLLELVGNYIKENFQSGISRFVKPLLGGALIATLIVANLRSFHFIPSPIMTPAVAQAFIELGRQTPPDAWIYTWWDYGYAIQYYARRATFHDGGTQGSPKTYFIALSFTVSSPQKGYNISQSLALCGKECIEKLLEEGKTPEQIKALFESGKLLRDRKSEHPIYWVFTGDLIGKFYWISYFGTWDFKTLKGRHYSLYQTVCLERPPKGIFCPVGGKTALFDPLKMVLVLNAKVYPVKIFAIRTPEELKIYTNKKFPTGNAIEKVFTFKRDFYLWYITEESAFYTNFNQMFVLRSYDKSRFYLSADRFPDYVFYELKK